MKPKYDIIVQGNNLSFEGGFFGLANVVLIRSDNGPVLFDTGHYCNRLALVEGLSRQGLRPSDISVVFLSHLHFDHSQNVDLFPKAKILVSRREWEYVESPHPDDMFVPWLIREQLDKHNTELLTGEGQIASGIEYIAVPGHTPGSYGLVLETQNCGHVVLAGDAIKYPKEIINRSSDMAFGGTENGTRSIARILDAADRLVPGHFAELVRRDGIFTWDVPATLTLNLR